MSINTAEPAASTGPNWKTFGRGGQRGTQLVGSGSQKVVLQLGAGLQTVGHSVKGAGQLLHLVAGGRFGQTFGPGAAPMRWA